MFSTCIYFQNTKFIQSLYKVYINLFNDYVLSQEKNKVYLKQDFTDNKFQFFGISADM